MKKIKNFFFFSLPQLVKINYLLYKLEYPDEIDWSNRFITQQIIQTNSTPSFH